MTDLSGNIADAARQKSIRAKCFHPTGKFIEFKKEEIEQSISNRFEEQVRRYPDRLAVKTKSHTLTYDALNRAANRVARTVLNHSGEEPVPVALLFEQDTSLIAALLGVLKLGNFYVPLDPSFPSSRTAFILKDSRVKLILTDRKIIPLAHELSQGICQVVNYDDIDPDISDENLGLSISPNQYAWLLYTSGSTGQPKGVVQNHRNVLHFVMNYTNGIHICSDDRLSLLRHISVFGAVRDILGALLNGATILPFDVSEVEMVLLSLDNVKEAVVVTQEDVSGNKRLVAYLGVFHKCRFGEIRPFPIAKGKIVAPDRDFPDLPGVNLISMVI